MAHSIYNCSGLTFVTIPDSVTSIGYEAFYGCTELTSVTIGASVESIGSSAFRDCYKLVEVYNKSSLDITAGSTSNGYIGYYAKNVYTEEGGSWLTDTSDGYRFLYDGTNGYLMGYRGNQTELALPASFTAYDGTEITEYGLYDYAFYNCSGLTSITIPAGVTSIGYRAFYNCTGLTEINWNAVSVADFDSSSNVFYNAGKTGDGITVTFGESVEKIPAYLFYVNNSSYSPNIKSVIIGSGVTSIGSYAFYNCSGLTSITIPDDVTSIGDRAFYNCTGLTEISWNAVSVADFDYYSDVFYNAGTAGAGIAVTFGENVEKIPAYAFADCTGLTEINWNAVSVADLSYSSDVFYKAGTAGDGIAVTFGESVEKIPAHLFYISTSSYRPNIKSVIIGSNVTSIGERAFYDCSGLMSITIPAGVTSIGYEAFYGCDGLMSVTIGSGVTSIGGSAFYGCYKLVEVYNKSSLSITAGSAFNGYISYYAKNVYTAEGGSWLTDTSDGYRFLYDGTNGYLIGYYGDQTELALPDSFTAYNGTEITEYGIYQYAFAYQTGITSVTIPDSVTSIGNRAFSVCSGLTSITIPDSVTYIGEYAFRECTGLTEISWNAVSVADFDYNSNVFQYAGTAGDGIAVTFGESVEKIPARLFYVSNSSYRPNIKSVIIGSDVTSIGSYAFRGCTAEIVWGDDPVITEIGDYAFAGYKGTSIVIPDSVTSIGNRAFYDCSGLTSITIPDSVTSIGSSAFYNTAWYNNQPEGLVYIGKVAYEYNGTMPSNTEIIIRDGTVGIGGSAFDGCSGLTSITIPDSVTSIGNRAFYGCTSLTSVTIPDSVTSIGDNAFFDCYKLVEVYNKSSLSITAGSTSNGYIGYYAKNVYTAEGGSWLTDTSDGYRFLYDGTNGYLIGYRGNQTELALPASFTAYDGTEITEYGIYDYAFRYQTSITSVTISDSVTSIGDYAFSGCDGLTSVTIGNGVTSIGSDAFRGCTGLTSVTIPDSVTTIGERAFYYCTGLTSITIPDGVTSIGDYAFYDCSGLTSVTIPDSVTTIGERAFYYCTGLTEISWNAVSVANLNSSSNVFQYAGTAGAGIAVTFGESVEKIPARLFYVSNSSYRPNIKSVIIGSNVTSIGNYAFSGCDGLTSITIPDGVTSIGSGAFVGCSALEKITIPFVGAEAGKTSSDTYQYPFGYIFGTVSYTGGTEVTQRYYGSSTSSTTNSTYYIPSSLREVTVTGGNILYGAFYIWRIL